MLLRIVGTDPPGRDCGPWHNVHVGIQARREPDQLVPADTDPIVVEAAIDIVERDDGDVDFRGPCVHGGRGDRFVYLTWGEIDPEGTFTMFRRAKLMLDALDAATIGSLEGSEATLEARLRLSDDNGLPRCAAVRPPAISWTRAPAEARIGGTRRLHRGADPVGQTPPCTHRWAPLCASTGDRTLPECRRLPLPTPPSAGRGRGPSGRCHHPSSPRRPPTSSSACPSGSPPSR
jgi:hypothetical protein